MVDTVHPIDATHVHPMTWTIFLVFYTRLQFPIDVVHQIYYAFLDAEYKDWRYYNQFWQPKLRLRALLALVGRLLEPVNEFWQTQNPREPAKSADRPRGRTPR